MNCISPLKASQNKDGDIVYSTRKALPGLVGFQFDCRKCLPCRLNQAREKAIRSVHEAKMHKDNIFLTLTYNEENLKSPWLDYRDFQLFMKKLRKLTNNKVTYMVTGEYGELNKRPHWHALIFNYAPPDEELKYTTEQGEKVYTSKTLDKIWNKGNLEYGSLTMDSANYVARYAAKKLVHGNDQEHDYHPIHKTSSRRGIGHPWIEKHWPHTFQNGYIVLPNGQTTKIPRYYVDWLKKVSDPNHKDYKPECDGEYIKYITGPRQKIMEKAEKASRKKEINHITNMMNYKGGRDYPLTPLKVSERILKTKFKILQEKLKL